ncbi:unnamed protein product [Ectocarpus sp. 12 AP-2014]
MRQLENKTSHDGDLLHAACIVDVANIAHQVTTNTRYLTARENGYAPSTSPIQLCGETRGRNRFIRGSGHQQMAPRQHNQQQRWRWASVPSASLLLSFVLVVTLSPLLASATSSSFFASFCLEETQACEADEECYECLLSWPATDATTCTDYSLEGGETACEENGIAQCCGFEEGTAESCMENALLEAFWTCTLADVGCSLEDMPCSATAVVAVSAAAPSIRPLSSMYGTPGAGLAAAVVGASAAAIGL